MAQIMGGKKSVPEVQMQAPYSEHRPGATPIRLLPPGPAAGLSSKKALIPQKDKSGLRVAGAGAGGVDEMAAKLNDETMQWGLLRFSIGSGTFKRNKMLLITFAGPKMTGMTRAKLAKYATTAETQFGDTAAKLTLDDRADCSIDYILGETKRVFAGDNLGEMSIADMKADYEKMLSDTRIKAIEAMLSGDAEAPKRKTAKELGVSAEKALELVRKPMGPMNWALFHPDPTKLELWDAGSLSVAEMNQTLPDDEVLCGLLRMGFGAGQVRVI